MSQVVLNPAFFWTCPECGRDHFERGIVPEMSPEDLEWHLREYGVEPWEEGEFVMMPETVICKHCSLEFEAIHY